MQRQAAWAIATASTDKPTMSDVEQAVAQVSYYRVRTVVQRALNSGDVGRTVGRVYVLRHRA
jgi:hypothetical protein